MNKKIIICSFALFFLFCGLASTAFAFWKSSTSEAENAISEALNLQSIGLESEARTKLQTARDLLVSALAEDSNNTNALFLLGKCEHYKGNYDSAYKKFIIAHKQNSGYGGRIYEFYSSVADQERKKGDIRRSIKYRLFAVQFNLQKGEQVVQNLIATGQKFLASGDFRTGHAYLETIRNYTRKYDTEIAQTYFEQGKSQLRAGNLREAHEYFGAARNITNEFDPEIARICYNSAENAENPETALMLYDWSVLYSSDYKTRAIERLKPIVKNLGVSSIRKISHIPRGDLQALKKLALNYRVYGPGDVYYFKGKKGEMSDHWIRASGDMQFQRKYGEWKLITRSGKQYEVGKVPDYLPEDYKVYALSDVHMRIKFSK
jgi:hypothetical protein